MKTCDKKYLLKLARYCIACCFDKCETTPEKVPKSLKEKRGVFVTLTKNRHLRGCIGYLEPIKPIAEAVVENAVNAAFRDTRFPPVRLNELKDIKIEISILTVPKPVASHEKIRPGKDGVILRQGFAEATFLPQVWQQLPDKERFLSELSMKAGLHPDAWLDSKTKFETYQVEEFNE